VVKLYKRVSVKKHTVEITEAAIVNAETRSKIDIGKAMQ
jgi:hypothetical protein